MKGPRVGSRLKVIGLDLAWKEDRPSGASVALWTEGEARLVRPTFSGPMDNDDVVEFVVREADGEPCVVAVDCPLSIPNPTGTRACDRRIAELFGAFHAGPHPANRTIFARREQLRGEELCNRLRNEFDYSLDPRSRRLPCVIEVYPHPAMIVLFDLPRVIPYKAKKGRTIAHRQEALADLQDRIASLATRETAFVIKDPCLTANTRDLRGKEYKAVEDALDSLVCAYVGLLFGLDGPRSTAIVGDERRGHIVVPMTHAWWERLGKPASPDILYEDTSSPPNP